MLGQKVSPEELRRCFPSSDAASLILSSSFFTVKVALLPVAKPGRHPVPQPGWDAHRSSLIPQARRILQPPNPQPRRNNPKSLSFSSRTGFRFPSARLVQSRGQQ